MSEVWHALYLVPFVAAGWWLTVTGFEKRLAQ
jgi:hypothetical protein